MPSGSRFRVAPYLATLLLCAVLVTPLRGFAQGGGRIVAVAVSPTLPDVVALERRVDDDTQELEFRRLSAAGVTPVRRTAALLTVPVVPTGSHERAIRRYSGDLDWRPVVGGDVHWFAYASGEADGVHVRVNYLRADGTIGLTTPLMLPGDPTAMAPRWSPDGRHLTFVSDSGQLLVASNIDRLLRGETTLPEIARVTPIGVRVRAPAWSPRGGFIAFESERTVRGASRHVIDVLPVDRVSGAPLGLPVTVTALVTENAYRPSWSPDDAFVAFYMDLGGGEDITPGIGVAELLRDARTGALVGGEVKQGRRSRRLAESVLPNESRGPMWTRFEGESIQGGRRPLPGIAFITNDPTRGNPVTFVTLERWLDNRTVAEASTELSAPWDSRDHRTLSIVEGAQRLRIAYTVAQSTGDVLRTRELLAEWAIGGVSIDDARPRRVVADADNSAAPATNPNARPVPPTASPITSPISSPVSSSSGGRDERTTARVDTRRRSFGGHVIDLFPAFMQMRQKRPVSALFILGTGAAAGYYMATGLNFPEGKSKPWSFELDRTKNNAAIGITAGSSIYLLGLIDGWRVDRKRTRTSFAVAPVVTPRGVSAALSLRIATH